MRYTTWCKDPRTAIRSDNLSNIDSSAAAHSLVFSIIPTGFNYAELLAKDLIVKFYKW